MSYVKRLIKEGCERSEEFRHAYEEEAQAIAAMGSLVELRKARGMSQNDVAAKLGVSQPRVAEIERGLSGMQVMTLFRYASVVGATIEVNPTSKSGNPPR
jgi:DNA-binding XRE family transcriptional regulator